MRSRSPSTLHEQQLAEARESLREEYGDDPARFARGGAQLAEHWDFREVNDLIERHNRHFPAESRLPMNPAHRRLRPRSTAGRTRGSLWTRPGFWTVSRRTADLGHGLARRTLPHRLALDPRPELPPGRRLLTAHNDEGAVGLILNRRSDATVGDAVPQLAPVTDLRRSVFVGGPVNPEGVAVLAEFDDPDEAGVVVLDDVGFVALDEALEEGAPDFQRTRVFAGVAGWGPEQLEDELERDDWIIEPADSTTSSPRIPTGSGARCSAARAGSTSSSPGCRSILR